MADERPTFGSLFAGIGGLDLGLERAGWECCWQVEQDPFCQSVLGRHWPAVARYSDVREARELPPVELICGGFPCQPVSVAGKKRAQQDERWLWPEFARIVGELRPRFVLVENVPGLLVRGGSDVLRDLAACGYDAEWDTVPAAALGAPHLRYRVFIVAWLADADGAGFDRERESEPPRVEGASGRESHGRHHSGRLFDPPPRFDQWNVDPAESCACGYVGGVADGVPCGVAHTPRAKPRGDEPERVARLRALGNAVVPQAAEWIGRRLLEVRG